MRNFQLVFYCLVKSFLTINVERPVTSEEVESRYETRQAQAVVAVIVRDKNMIDFGKADLESAKLELRPLTTIN